MKKKLVIGMVALAAVLSYSGAQAAGAKSLREVLVDYTRTVKDARFGKDIDAKNIEAKRSKEVKEQLIKDLDLPAREAQDLSMSVHADPAKVAQRLESLATIVAAKKLAEDPRIKTSSEVEAKSILDAATASEKVLKNSLLVGARKSSGGPRGKEALLSTTEMSETTLALNKLETLPESILTKFSKSERDSYSQIINRYDEIVQRPQEVQSAEEAFVKAIMDVKKVDKEKALEIVKKLKECV